MKCIPANKTSFLSVSPVAFLVLQAIPDTFPLASTVLLPTVLVLLPLGSLYMTQNSMAHEAAAAEAKARLQPQGKAKAHPDSAPNSKGTTILSSSPLVNAGRGADGGGGGGASELETNLHLLSPYPPVYNTAPSPHPYRHAGSSNSLKVLDTSSQRTPLITHYRDDHRVDYVDRELDAIDRCE